MGQGGSGGEENLRFLKKNQKLKSNFNSISTENFGRGSAGGVLKTNRKDTQEKKKAENDAVGFRLESQLLQRQSYKKS